MATNKVKFQPHSNIGRLRAFHRDPLAFLSFMAREMGPVAQFKMGPWPFALVTGAAEVQGLLNTSGKDLLKGPGMDSKNPLIGRGLLISEGDLWRQERFAVQPLFDHRRIKQYGEQMVSAAAQFRDRALREMKPLAIDREMLNLTLKIAVQTLFGGDDTEEDLQHISEAVQTVMTYFFRRSRSAFRWPYHWRVPGMMGYHRAADDLRQWMSGYLAESPEGFAAQRLHEGLPDDGDAAFQTALTLIMAGHETTGHALSWTLGLLADHPEEQKRLVEEVASVLGGEPPCSADVDRLPYLRAVIYESLRLYPPVWLVSRLNPQELTLGEVHFAPQTFFLVSPYVSQRLPEYFPHPDEFQPDRWMEDGNAVMAKMPPGYLPFGLGARSCVGKDFALLEMSLVIATIMQGLGFRPGHTFSLKPVPRLSLVPPQTLVLNLQPVGR